MVLIQGSYIKVISKVVSSFFFSYEEFENLMKNEFKIVLIYKLYSFFKMQCYVCLLFIMSKIVKIDRCSVKGVIYYFY